MKIIVNDQIHLSEFHLADQAACVEYLNEKEIYDRTLLAGEAVLGPWHHDRRGAEALRVGL